MDKILVTGGLGFIGSHTVVELQNSGYEVIIIDDSSNSSVDVLHRISTITGITPKFEQIDLKNKAKVIDFFKRNKDLKGGDSLCCEQSCRRKYRAAINVL